MHGDQFLWQPESASVAYVDNQHFIYNLDKLKRPVGYAAMDFYNFLAILKTQGILKGLVLSEIDIVDEAFTQGYHWRIRLNSR